MGLCGSGVRVTLWQENVSEENALAAVLIGNLSSRVHLTRETARKDARAKLARNTREDVETRRSMIFSPLSVWPTTTTRLFLEGSKTRHPILSGNEFQTSTFLSHASQSFFQNATWRKRATVTLNGSCILIQVEP